MVGLEDGGVVCVGLSSGQQLPALVPDGSLGPAADLVTLADTLDVFTLCLLVRLVEVVNVTLKTEWFFQKYSGC